MNNTKPTIINLLLTTDRKGMGSLIEYLEEGSDFFEAPASTKHHCAYVGGLAEHSLNVYNTLMMFDGVFGMGTPDDQLIITALLHDVCKMNFYVQQQAWRKDDRGKWESYTRWGINDTLPLGHGEKSLYIVSKFIQLSDAEAAAIRWHEGAWTAGVTTNYVLAQSYNTAVDKYPLVSLLSAADALSARIIEKRTVL